jgi:hypothetical protein
MTAASGRESFGFPPGRGYSGDVKKTGGTRKARTAKRVLIIVSRDAPELYRHLKYAFDGNDAIRVIRDRRRRPLPLARAERRRLGVETALRTLGWAVVRYPLESEDPFGPLLPEVAARV